MRNRRRPKPPAPVSVAVDDIEEDVEEALDEARAALASADGAPDTTRQSAVRVALTTLSAKVTAERDARNAEAAAAAEEAVQRAARTAATEGDRKPLLLQPFRLGFLGGLGVLVAYVSFLSLDSIRSTLVIIAVAALIAIGLDPAVSWLVRRRFKRGWAVTTVFLALLALLAGAMVAIVPPVVNEVAKLITALPTLIDDLGKNSTIKSLDERYGILNYVQNSDFLKNLGTTTAGGIWNATTIAAAVLSDLFIVLVLTMFFLAGMPKIKAGAWRLAPSSRRPRVAELGDKVIDQMGGYLSGAFLVAMQAGIVAGVFAAIVGLPYPWAIALGAFILDFVPVIGPILVGVSMTLLGLSQSVTLAIVAGAFYLVQHMFETYWLYPRVMRRQVNISTGAVVLAIIVGAALLGITGALLAVPVAAGVQLIFREVVLPRQDSR